MAFPVNYQCLINDEFNLIQGDAASIIQRNKSNYSELDVKQITTSNIEKSFYNPKSYLSPFKDNETQRDLSLNSLHMARLYNKKMAALESITKKITNPAKLMRQDEFTSLKRSFQNNSIIEKTNNNLNVSEAYDLDH